MALDVSMTLSGAIQADELKQLIVDNTPVPIKEAADRFKWDERLIQKDNYQKKIDAFIELHPELAQIDREGLYATIEDSFHLIEELNAMMIPTERSQTMNYHNEVHSKITAIQNLKHVLGGMALAMKNGTLPDELRDPENMNKFLRLSVSTAACHEVNDWMVRPITDPVTHLPHPNEVADKQTRIGAARERIGEYLEAHALSCRDFNVLIEADNFSKPPEQVMAELGLIQEFLLDNGLTQGQFAQVVGAADFDPTSYKHGAEIAELASQYKAKDKPLPTPFLDSDNDGEESILETLMRSGRDSYDAVLPIYTYAIGAADFGQIGNTEYLRTIKVMDYDEQVYSVPAGPMALVYEMFKYTPDWVVSQGFGTYDQNGRMVLNWENVTTGDFFWNNFAQPRIKNGLASMMEFSPGQGGEGENAEKLFNNVTRVVEENTAKLKASKQLK